MLALLSLLTQSSGVGMVFAWIFNLWGAADLFNAFYEANSAALIPGQLGVAYFLPTLGVPLLLVTHVVMFRILLQREHAAALTGESRLVA